MIKSFEQELREAREEIERLNAADSIKTREINTLVAENRDLVKISTELADALEIHSSTYPGAPIEKLIQKAREAVK